MKYFKLTIYLLSFLYICVGLFGHAQPALAAISRIGSLTEIDSSADSSSQSVSVPSDAQIMIVSVSGYHETNMFSSGVVSIGGDNLTAISGGDASNSYFMGAMFYKVLPKTNTQTLAWNWSGTADPKNNGVIIVYGFYKGIDTSGIRDSYGTQNAAASTATKTFSTAQSGDMIIAWQHLYDGNGVVDAFSWTNATKISDFDAIDGGYRNAAASWAEGSPSGSTTVTCTHTSTDGGITAIVLKPAVSASAALTGTITSSVLESDIVAGGKTAILTLTGDTWVASGATFNAQRQNIINGLVSAQSETHGWNNEVKAKIAVTDVVRTSNTVVTVTLDAEAGYDITSNETITATIPSTAVAGGAQIVASPTFTVSPYIPPTEFVSVVDPGGAGDYSSLSDWNTAVSSDLTAASTKVFSGSKTGTVSDGDTVSLCNGGSYQSSTATVKHAGSLQILVASISGTPTFVSGYQWRKGNGTCADSSNYFQISSTGNSVIAVADCQTTNGAADTAAVTIDGWTTSATNYIKIWTDPSEGYRHAGKWDASKYRIESSDGGNLDISENYVRIDGLQLKVLGPIEGDGRSNIRFIGTFANSSNEEWVSNNIIRGDPNNTYAAFGIAITDDYVSLKAWNNIAYDMSLNNSCIDIDYNSTGYIYNNTCVGGGGGIIGGYGGTAILKNNLVYNSNDNYVGSFDASSINNLSDHADAPGSNPRNSVAVSFVSATPGSEDFHLAATDTGAFGEGADLTSDANIPITTDIDGQNRPNLGDYSWDIGADQAIHNTYASVGQNNSTDYSSGGNVTVSGIVANFTTPQTNSHIGVGDVLTYNSSNGCYLARKITTSSWICLSFETFGAPTAASNVGVNSIKHHYTSLNAVLSAMSGDDLVSGNLIENVPCYYDSGPDTTAVTVQNITTDADHYVRIYTPYDTTNEVNQSQRASGKWDAGKYSLSVGSATAINIGSTNAEDVWIDGLQVYTHDYTGNDQNAIFVRGLDSNSEVKISNNILKGSGDSTQDWDSGIGVYGGSFSGGAVKIWNNVIYDFNQASGNSAAGINAGNLSVTEYIYANTVYGCGVGIGEWGTAPVLKNNLAYANTDNYIGSFDGSSANNLSGPDQSDAPGSNPQNSATVSFVGAAQNDFRLALSDTAAKGKGVNLSADANLAFHSDIENKPRPGSGIAWDIGASQAGNAEINSPNLPGGSKITINMSLTDKMKDGLVGMWSFDGPDMNWATDTAYDRSGNGNNGTISGATPTAGKNGQALSFNGTSNYVDTGSDLLGTGTFTACMWAKPESDNEVIIGNGYFLMGTYKDGEDNKYWLVSNDSGGTGATSAYGSAVLDTWQHVCTVRQSNGLSTIYVNGAVSGNLNQDSGTPGTYSFPMVIGAWRGDGSGAFKGSIDEVRVYNRALSAKEIGDLYRMGNVTMKETGSQFVAGSLLVTDNFNRDDTYPDPIGGNWTTITGLGNIVISGDKAYTLSYTESGVYWNANTPNANQYSQIKFISNAEYQGPAVRIQPSAFTAYVLQASSLTSLDLYRVVNGTWGSPIATWTVSTMTAGSSVVKLSASGTGATVNLCAYVDGVQQGSCYADTNASRITTAGSFGFYEISGAPQALDDWEGGNL